MVIQQKFTSTLFSAWRTWNEKKKMWENGVSCSVKAKLWCMARAEVGTSLWPWVSWKKVNAKFARQAFHTFWIKRKIFWPARVWEMTKRQKTLCRNSWKAWQWPFLTKAYQSWSHNMTSDLIYMATGCSRSFIVSPTCCNKEIFFFKFFKHSLNPFSSYFLDSYINTLA